ncbi:MAG: helix-turn-helix transcriptional regulator [Clostridia bacterium]|nr:helix-turn-helix transcriptional regulator [Clostridia bacterium]
MNIFCVRLKELRTNKKISQKKLAEILGTTNSSICDWECGRSEPCFEILVKLAIFFDVTTDFLLGLEDETGLKIKNNDFINIFAK